MKNKSSGKTRYVYRTMIENISTGERKGKHAGIKYKSSRRNG